MWHVGSGGGGSRGGGVDVKFLTFSGGRDGVTKIEHLRRRGKGSKFRSFCENVIIECILIVLSGTFLS